MTTCNTSRTWCFLLFIPTTLSFSHYKKTSFFVLGNPSVTCIYASLHLFRWGSTFHIDYLTHIFPALSLSCASDLFHSLCSSGFLFKYYRYFKPVAHNARKCAEIRARVTLDLDFRGEMHVVSYDITGNPF